jgi:hypothetical protein
MSEILNRLKQAEAERERVIAERKRLESEADAALDAREREEFVRSEQLAARPVQAPQQALPAQPTPQQSSRLAAAVAMAAALAVVFWIGTLMPRKPAAPAMAPPPAAAVSTAAPAPPPPARTPPELFRLERDLDAFASRVKDKS